MSDDFKIGWSLDESAWDVFARFAREHAAGGAFDQKGAAIFWSPPSPVQMTFNGHNLLLDQERFAPLEPWYVRGHWAAGVTRPRRLESPFQFCILSIAKPMAVIIDSDWFRTAPGTCEVHLGDGESSMYFRVRRFTDFRGILIEFRHMPFRGSPTQFGEVFWPSIDMDHPASQPLRVPESNFLMGVQVFLSELSTELFQRFPEFRDWESFSPFLEYERA